MREQSESFETTSRDAQMKPNETNTRIPRIAVVGVGGAGCNVVSAMAGSGCPVDTIAINTDKESLHRATADKKIYICKAVLKGEGTRGDAELGKRCADIHREEIRESLSGYDYVFAVAGLGGGTGSGALPTVIDAATVGGAEVFTLAINPFQFETGRCALAKESVHRVKAVCRRGRFVENESIIDWMSDMDMKAALDKLNESLVCHIEDCVRWLLAASLLGARAPEDSSRRPERTNVLPIGMIVSA